MILQRRVVSTQAKSKTGCDSLIATQSCRRVQTAGDCWPLPAPRKAGQLRQLHPHLQSVTGSQPHSSVSSHFGGTCRYFGGRRRNFLECVVLFSLASLHSLGRAAALGPAPMTMTSDAGAEAAWSTRYGPAVAYTASALGVTVTILIIGELLCRVRAVHKPGRTSPPGVPPQRLTRQRRARDRATGCVLACLAVRQPGTCSISAFWCDSPW